jgi:hypothetical protein
MSLMRWAVVLSWFSIFATCFAACGSRSPAPSDGASNGSPDGSSDRAAADSPHPLADGPASPDSAPSDSSTPDSGCSGSSPPFDARSPADASCTSFDDTDRDGIRDCADGCPYDPSKIAPGVCGCNSADFDSDGDGVPDCIDECPQDPNNTVLGQCGCVGRPGLKAAGTPCDDTACLSATTCDGAGVCGDRSACSPCPGGHYVVLDVFHYWFCTALPVLVGPSCALENVGASPTATRIAAQSACAAKGLSLARIQTLSQNRAITRLLPSRVWIGANDLDTPGQWYWSSPTSNSDLQFWSGGLDGGPQDFLFANWGNGAPGGAACASIGVDGRWSDTDCNQTLGYICQ